MEIREDDYGYNINFTVKQSDGTAFDLTGYTVNFQVVESNSRRNIVDGACVLVTEADGTCKYTVVSGDFPKGGNYIGGLELTISGKVFTTKDIFINVKKSLNP